MSRQTEAGTTRCWGRRPHDIGERGGVPAGSGHPARNDHPVPGDIPKGADHKAIHPSPVVVGLLAAVLGFMAGGIAAAESSYRQIGDGVVVYFGMIPAELVRGHPPAHPESTMHGGVQVGENHLTVAVFDDKTGRRITDAKVTAHITDDRSPDMEKQLESMVIAGSVTYGSYFYMPGAGPYRSELRIRLSDRVRELRVIFAWARS